MRVAVVDQLAPGTQRILRLCRADETTLFVPADHVADLGVDQMRSMQASVRQLKAYGKLGRALGQAGRAR